MLRKFDRFARKRAFMGKSVGEFERWRTETRTLLHELLGTEKMESSPAQPQLLSTTAVEGGITREHWRIQVEPEVWMTLFLLVPESADKTTSSSSARQATTEPESIRWPVCGATHHR